ncbi:VOC family protein [Jidongwangia harbinensis]|uniref:VOC family protein n=1 Tax=Jidongwangia harbinensis TaxID=2878561 RepID=UPI001CDA4D0A|nr:VOC family protein [Jidongwangia harbinensis]MCA2214958.1 hypothetical protein [Jidongwangia harbinensis]
MAVRWVTGFLDTPAASAAAAEAFWAAVTGSGWSARRGGGAFATLLPPGGDAFLRVQVVGDGPARCHLDLHTDAVAQVADLAESLGARRVHVEPDLVVCRSPAGLPFCVVRWQGERVRPAAVAWRGGQRSLVDQVCLDLPRAGFDAEAGFWAALTGWERRAVGLPEFDVLRRPQGQPLRLLLQRTGGESAGMHLDLACDDVAAEVARHVTLGASVVRRVPDDWTTLRDPAGREYCVTARSPD